ncbi:DUF1918 domain-containing protein [Streptomyces thermolilacinus]|uniref:DUF1918 domain-containing protein n=1 Tax=Streptomyces thermolilacinus TaxID=285540 RepID=UPI0033C3F7A2
MQAKVGDRIVLHGQNLGRSDRTGEIVEVRGENGSPPYLVRFEDGRETLIYPGPDTDVDIVSASGGSV